MTRWTVISAGVGICANNAITSSMNAGKVRHWNWFCAAAQPIKLGLRAGRMELISYLLRLQTMGVEHEIFNRARSGRGPEEVIRELGEHVLRCSTKLVYPELPVALAELRIIRAPPPSFDDKVSVGMGGAVLLGIKLWRGGFTLGPVLCGSCSLQGKRSKTMVFLDFDRTNRKAKYRTRFGCEAKGIHACCTFTY